jgi:putative two-component system response regulator
MLSRDGYLVDTVAGEQAALEAVADRLPDVIVLDVMMPGLDGFETCRRLKADRRTRLIPIVLIAALQCTDDRIRAIEAGADDFISKSFNQLELRARVRSLVRIKHYTDDLDTADSVMLSLGLTIEARDPSTNGHCQRLAAYASALGTRLGLDRNDLAALTRGGFLHDIGKVGVPDSVLLKQGPLTHDEYEQVKLHPVIGDRLCGELRSLRRVQPIIRSHHEHLDGSGYPDRLRGDAIPMLAQIVGVVDVFDALTSERPYKPALSRGDACDQLRQEVANGWRADALVESFVEIAAATHLPLGGGA